MTSTQSPIDRQALLQHRIDGLLGSAGLRYSLRRRLNMRVSGCLAAGMRRELASLFTAVLGESQLHAAGLARQWIYYRLLARESWLTEGARTRRHSYFDPPPPRVLDEPALGAYLAQTPGVVLASIHMGDYLQGLAALTDVLQGRRLQIVRRLDASDAEQAAFSRLHRAGIRFEVLRHDSGVVRAAIRGLRQGAVLVVLYDLSRRWGRTRPVRLLGRNAELVCGPVDLAVAAGADLLPIVTAFNAEGQLEIEAGAVMRAHARSNPARSNPARSNPARLNHARLNRDLALQRLADFADQRIRRDPAQWNHWTLFPELIAHDGRGLASASNDAVVRG